MKQIESSAEPIPYVEYAYRSASVTRRRLLRTSVAVALLAASCVAAWYGYQTVAKPRLDASRLESALAMASDADSDIAQRLKNWPSEQPRESWFLGTYNLLSQSIAGLNDEIRRRGARAALDLAITEGSLEAKLTLGKAHRDGKFGSKDMDAALRQFDAVGKSNAAGVRAGDPMALYIQAIMLKDGLGVETDKASALALVRRATEGLPRWQLSSLAQSASRGTGFFEGAADIEFSDKVVARLMDAGDTSAYRTGTLNCARRYSRQSATVGKALIDADDCRLGWISRAARAGYRPAMSDYALSFIQRDGDLEQASRYFVQAGDALDARGRFYFAMTRALIAKDQDTMRVAITQMLEALNHGTEKDRLGISVFELTAMMAMVSNFHGVARGPRIQEVAERLALVLRTFAEAEDDVRVTRLAIRELGLSSTVVRAFDSPVTVAAARRLLAEPSAGTASTGLQQPLTVTRPSKGFVPFSGTMDVKGTRDAEQQDRTGYVSGAPNIAQGGRSTFTVDNSRGGGDAVARLYVNGKKPAVRSLFVKQGERFTATALMPAVYTLRYRYMGSEDTFEADQPFTIAEVEEPGGMRYSKVTVTLFSVRDGNLQTKRVPPDQF